MKRDEAFSIVGVRRLPIRIRRGLKVLAIERGTTMEAIVTEAIVEKLAKDSRRSDGARKP